MRIYTCIATSFPQRFGAFIVEDRERVWVYFGTENESESAVRAEAAKLLEQRQTDAKPV